MEKTEPKLDKIRSIAWTLSMASGKRCLDVPGEYVWAYPGSVDKVNMDFDNVRQRYKSIFSSGNSIKDPELIQFIQKINLNKHLLDPWIVEKYEQGWMEWIKRSNGKNYALKNLELFSHACYSQGTQESFLNFYMMNRNKRFRVFKGEYWWHMDIWSKLDYRWSYIEDDDIRDGDICIVSCPFALYGRKHKMLDELIEKCERLGVEILLDFIYLPNSMNKTVDIDLSASCIKQITFSLSKTFPVQCAKIALRLTKHKLSDPMQMSNDENISNRLAAGLGFEIMNNFPLDHMTNKYRDQQSKWCDIMGLEKTNVVHFAYGPHYHKKTNTETNFCSPYNVQDGRYNLGMLYENHKLLERVGLDE